jgi:hypothetical protein
MRDGRKGTEIETVGKCCGDDSAVLRAYIFFGVELQLSLSGLNRLRLLLFSIEENIFATRAVKQLLTARQRLGVYTHHKERKM